MERLPCRPILPIESGMLAMGWQICPDPTGDQLLEILFASAYADDKAMIINPPRLSRWPNRRTTNELHERILENLIAVSVLP